jgi:hypothetical protein
MMARVSSFSRNWAAELGMFVKMRAIVPHTGCSESRALLEEIPPELPQKPTNSQNLVRLDHWGEQVNNIRLSHNAGIVSQSGHVYEVTANPKAR